MNGRAGLAMGLLLSALWPARVDAWGATGHRAVGQIASDLISERTREAVRELLGGSTLAEVSTWADEIRGDLRWEWLAPYHYVNLDPRRGTLEGCPPEGCILDGIESALQTLHEGNATRREQEQALRLLVHFVGDLHQPLHVSHAADRGGNDIEVTFFGEPTNLHWVWDTGVLHRSGRWRKLARRLETELAREAPAQRRAMREGTPEQWAMESYRLATGVVYPSVSGGRDHLGRSYVGRFAPLAERRVLLAGIRLAGLLDSIWAASASAESPSR